MKILVLNLTRVGDQLQTSPVIAGLRECYPGAEVTVCVDRNFSAVCHGLPGVDRVWELDFDSLGHLLLARGARELRAAWASVDETVRALRAERFDLALNYSSSRMSAVLMALVGVPDARGWTMTRDGHRRITQPWSRLFAACALVRRQGPFNLVDHYKRIAGVRGGPRRLLFDVPAEAQAGAARLLAAAGHRGEPLVALQLGASRAARRWPVPSFVALGRRLAERLGVRLLLCGGPGERDVAAEVAAGLGPLAVDVCARTSIAELGALLAGVRLLVTSDTGPMHLAVAVGTPVVSMFFGPALPTDTGPYVADAVCLHAEVACAPCDHAVTCLEPFCRDVVEPAAVAEAVVARLAEDWARLDAAARRWPAIGWYRTAFDADGLFDLVPLGGRAPGPRERLRRAYRALWKETLDGASPAGDTFAVPEAVEGLLGLERLAIAGVGAAADVARLARARTAGALARLEAAARRLEAAAQDILRWGAAHEPAALLVQTYCLEREAIEGDDVAALANGSRALHERLARRARRLVTLLAPPEAAAGVHRVKEEETHACNA